MHQLLKMLEVKQIVTFVHSGLNPIADEMCHSNYVEQYELDNCIKPILDNIYLNGT